MFKSITIPSLPLREVCITAAFMEIIIVILVAVPLILYDASIWQVIMFGAADILLSSAVITGVIKKEINLLYPYIFVKWVVLFVSACVVGLSTLVVAGSYILLQIDRTHLLGLRRVRAHSGIFTGFYSGGIALIIIILNIIPAKIIEDYKKRLLDVENRKALQETTFQVSSV